MYIVHVIHPDFEACRIVTAHYIFHALHTHKHTLTHTHIRQTKIEQQRIAPTSAMITVDDDDVNAFDVSIGRRDTYRAQRLHCPRSVYLIRSSLFEHFRAFFVIFETSRTGHSVIAVYSAPQTTIHALRIPRTMEINITIRHWPKSAGALRRCVRSFGWQAKRKRVLRGNCTATHLDLD